MAFIPPYVTVDSLQHRRLAVMSASWIFFLSLKSLKNSTRQNYQLIITLTKFVIY